MKKNLALLLAVILVLSSMFALGTVAGAETKSAAPSLEIAYFNVSFKTNVSLLFAVPADEYTVKADGTVEGLQLLVWKTGKSDGTYSMADATKNGVTLEARGTTQINGVPHIVFSYSALSAAEMCETVYARLIRHDSKGYRAYSEIYDYSIAEFVNGYLNSTNPLHNQKELVSDMMDYGSAVAEYSNLVDKTSYLTYDADVVKALKKVTVNAVLNGDVVATSKQLVKSGEVSSLVAPVVNGAEFKSWSDNASGGKVNVTADTTVTATYTNKIVSSYNIDSSSVGAYVSSNAVKVLQFASDPSDVAYGNDYWPHNYGRNCVVYTGTHDNETLAGRYAGLSKAGKQQLRDYIYNQDIPDAEMYKALLHLTMHSVAKDCIIPVQDHLGLDNTCRMNQPGTVGFNWRWRMLPKQLTAKLAKEVKAMTIAANRANWDAIHAAEEKEAE